METKKYQKLIESVNQVVQEKSLDEASWVKPLVSGVVKASKMCAGNALCRRAALAGAKWGVDKIKDRIKDKKNESSPVIEYTDTESQPDYEHPSFQADFVNARAKLERDRWLAIHGKKGSHLVKKQESVEVQKRNELIERFKRVVLGEQKEPAGSEFKDKIAELERKSKESEEDRKKKRLARKKKQQEFKKKRETRTKISYRTLNIKDPHLNLKKIMGKERYNDWQELSTSPKSALTPGQKDRLRMHNLKVKHIMPTELERGT